MLVNLGHHLILYVCVFNVSPSGMCPVVSYYRLKKLISIGLYLIYNVVLVSGVQKSDSVIYIYICILL